MQKTELGCVYEQPDGDGCILGPLMAVSLVHIPLARTQA